jgi:hypothetical protein
MTAPEISDDDPGVVVALPDVRKRRRPTATRKRCAKAPRPLPLLRLRDGASILVRPVTSGDREVIADAYNGLSDQTRYRRFQSTAPHLLPRDLDPEAWATPKLRRSSSTTGSAAASACC